MKVQRFKVVLLSIFLFVSLSALMGTTEAKVYPDVENIILRGKETAYGMNLDAIPPMGAYVVGDCPPIMAADRIGSGVVVAASLAATGRGWNEPGNPDPHYDVLLDELFQWMVPGATNVIWYEGYNVYNNCGVCTALISALMDLGYDIACTDTEPIASLSLDAFDILVLNQTELGTEGTGDPSLFPDSDVQAIKTWVEGGGGLVVMEQSDFLSYNYYRVHNKILDGLGFSPGGLNLRFQSAALYDDVNNYGELVGAAGDPYRPIVDVDTTTAVGAAYQSRTGKSTLGVYSPGSLAVPGLVISIVPSFEVGMPGTELAYRVTVFNSYTEDVTINLSVTDTAGWGLDLDDDSLGLMQVGENKTTTLRVTIPDGASLGVEDEITVTASASEYPEVSDSASCIAHTALRLEVTSAAYVDSEGADLNFDNYALYVGRYGTNWQFAYLKFDNLSEIPSGVTITEARLYLFCWSSYGSAQLMQAKEVEDDVWFADLITWNNKPESGAVLDTQLVGIGSEAEPVPYSWDVTSFVQQEFAGDGVASLLVCPPDNCPEETNRRFRKDEFWDPWLRPFLMITYPMGPGVEVSISPDSQSDQPGETVTFTVTVKNIGTVEDTYVLETTDTEGWSLSLSQDSVGPLNPGASTDVTLEVTIPSTAESGDSTTITVTATSQADPAVSDSDTCTARAVIGVGGVEVTIDPTTQSGSAGEEITYTVTVTNTGTLVDTYSFEATDSWNAELSTSSCELDPGGSQTVDLTVSIPENAAEGDSTMVTVAAVGTYAENSATCTAEAEAAAAFPLIPVVGGVVVIVVIIAAILVIRR